MNEKYAIFRIINQKYSSSVVDICLIMNEMMVYRLRKCTAL